MLPAIHVLETHLIVLRLQRGDDDLQDTSLLLLGQSRGVLHGDYARRVVLDVLLRVDVELSAHNVGALSVRVVGRVILAWRREVDIVGFLHQRYVEVLDVLVNLLRVVRLTNERATRTASVHTEKVRASSSKAFEAKQWAVHARKEGPHPEFLRTSTAPWQHHVATTSSA